MPKATDPFEELRVTLEAAAAPFVAAMTKLAEDISRAFPALTRNLDRELDDLVREQQLAAVPGQVACEGEHAHPLPGINALRRVGGWKCKHCGAAV